MNYKVDFPVLSPQTYLINALFTPKITLGVLLGKQWELEAKAGYGISLFDYNLYTSGIQKDIANVYKDGRRDGANFMISINKNLNP